MSNNSNTQWKKCFSNFSKLKLLNETKKSPNLKKGYKMIHKKKDIQTGETN